MSHTVHERTVALNTDCGEGFGNWSVDDAEILSIVSDANIACGFHAGDPDTLARTCTLAADYGIGVGAHVGFHDLRGFGRRYIAVPRETLTNDVLYQIGALEAFAAAAGTAVSYVKPHGALYHSAARHDDHAKAIIDAITSRDRPLALLCQTDSLLADYAREASVPVVAEGFMDRAYSADGTLVARSEPGAVIKDASLAAEQAVQMVTTQTVTATDGTSVPMNVQSLCIHSDSPGAVDLARTVRAALEGAGVHVKSANDPR
jgi:5-oxoprolinase (ATP-hydrolysing) subunit A